MADRSAAAIRIGGHLPHALAPDLVEAIEIEGVSTDWDGTPFSPDDLLAGRSLYLVATEVAGGTFDHLEDFCYGHDLPFARWCDGYRGSYGPQRVVFDGTDAMTFVATEDDEVLISLEDIERLGSMDAIHAHFAKANATIPPLELTGTAPADGGDDA